MKILGMIDKGIDKGSGHLLVVCVFSMLSLSVLGIVLRWFSITFLWFEPLIRHLVFLSTFLGGVLATGRGTHIGIDIISKYLESSGRTQMIRGIKIIISLASFLTLIWLTKASIGFVKVELQYGKNVFLGIHSGFLVAIIPFGFSLISFRFFYKFIEVAFLSKKEEK